MACAQLELVSCQLTDRGAVAILDAVTTAYKHGLQDWYDGSEAIELTAPSHAAASNTPAATPQLSVHRHRPRYRDWQRLRYLDLSHNPDLGSGRATMGVLTDMVQHSTTLRQLGLAWCGLRGALGSNLVEALGRNRSLQCVDLSWNALGAAAVGGAAASPLPTPPARGGSKDAAGGVTGTAHGGARGMRRRTRGRGKDHGSGGTLQAGSGPQPKPRTPCVAALGRVLGGHPTLVRRGVSGWLWVLQYGLPLGDGTARPTCSWPTIPFQPTTVRGWAEPSRCVRASSPLAVHAGAC